MYMAFAVSTPLLLMFEPDENVWPCVFRVDQEDQEVALGTLRRLDL